MSLGDPSGMIPPIERDALERAIPRARGAKKMTKWKPPNDITKRQRVVCILFKAGYSFKQVALLLNIRIATVENIVRRAL